MSCQTTRRTFVKQIAYAGAAAPLLRPALIRAAPANNKLSMAFIALGAKGKEHVARAKRSGVTCPAFCEVDIKRQGVASGHWPDAVRYQDYRLMFDKHRGEIDAVMIATPDHHHYLPSMIALQNDIHCYTQKPLTWSVREARLLAEEAARRKVATQMGNQGHAGVGWRRVYDWVNSRVLGTVTETHTWTNRPVWPQGKPRPAGEDPVPAHLDWDQWIGPAPMRPYKANAYHAWNWRGWWDFGAGALGDMACHTMDGVFWALNPDPPTAVEVLHNSGHDGDAFPASSIIKWEFPAKGNRAAFSAFWYDGGKMPPRPDALEDGRNLPRTGNLFIGTKATLLVGGDYGESPRIVPETKMQELAAIVKAIEPMLPLPPQIGSMEDNHHEEFMLAATGQRPHDSTLSSFAYAGPMTETIQLGNAALRAAGKEPTIRLEYDGAKLEFRGNDRATASLWREPRDGWSI